MTPTITFGWGIVILLINIHMIYTAEQLERNFKDLSRLRKGKEYENDAGYWTGGKCNWGGSHNLKEDCETLSKAFNKMESLREIQDELKKCTNKSEYDAKKANYIRKCEELIDGLQAKTGSNSSMFTSVLFGLMKQWISMLFRNWRLSEVT